MMIISRSKRTAHPKGCVVFFRVSTGKDTRATTISNTALTQSAKARKGNKENEKIVSYSVLKEADYNDIMNTVHQMHRTMCDMHASFMRLFDAMFDRNAFKDNEEKNKFLMDFHDAQRSSETLRSIDRIDNNILRSVVRKCVEVDLGL